MFVETLAQVKITAIIQETPDAKTFVLEPLKNWMPVYKAGQFLTIVFHTKFGEKRRSYSLSSSPEQGEPLSITVKKVDNGEFSRKLLDSAQIGEVLDVAGIGGFFSLPEDDTNTEQVFFLAAGSGITPCYAMIKTLLLTTTKQVVLIYSNRSEEDTIFLKQLRALEEKYPATFQLKFLNSNGDGVLNRRLSKWLLTILLKEFLKTDLNNVLFYLCGPFEYMQMIRITLLIEGVGDAAIRKEIYTPLPVRSVPVPPDTREHIVKIRSGQHLYEFSVQYPATILAAAKAKGITLPYSCEAGICGACSATCVKGNVWMLYNGVLTEREIARGRVLTCQGFPVEGDVELILGAKMEEKA